MADLRLITVIVTALVDSINPCAIGVLILLISVLLSLSKQKKRMLWVGMLYISIVYLAYFLAGLGLLYFIQILNIGDILGVVVGSFVIILGLIEIKDFYFHGRGISLAIPKRYVGTIKKYAKTGTVPAVIALGFLVAAVELPCTGGPYLAITTILAKNFDLQALWYLALYNFIFVLPLIIILFLAYCGASAKSLDNWKKANRKWMNLAMGLLMVTLGVLLILMANGDISLV